MSLSLPEAVRLGAGGGSGARSLANLRAAPSMVTSANAQFVEELAAEAVQHRAVTHPYLRALAGDSLPDTRWALQDFARQYRGYSLHFPRYLATTISRLTDPRHRTVLLENLREESGQYDEDDLEVLASVGIERSWVEGVPHPELFANFCQAMGVTDEDEEDVEVCCWREMFLAVLAQGSEAESVGAIGLGTETVVKSMYQNILPALSRAGVNARDGVFFPLHALVDDKHQHSLNSIAIDFAGTQQGRRDLEKGMRKALRLRAGFWDWMLERAESPVKSNVWR